MDIRKHKRTRNADDAASFGELKTWYTQIIQELDDCKRNYSAAAHLSKNRFHEAKEAKTEVRKVSRRLVTMTKKDKAREEANKAGMWAGGAAVSVTIMYEIFKVQGFPGGIKWMAFWNHEAVFGAIMWLVTITFGLVYRASHPE
tara:strand:- start:4477 stop:4908 length:432 start_codon:yes stop_codon:yes gene_type:complete